MGFSLGRLSNSYSKLAVLSVMRRFGVILRTLATIEMKWNSTECHLTFEVLL